MRYLLKAVDGANQVVDLELEAADESAAAALARQKGLAVISVAKRGLDWRSAPSFPTTLFSVELLALLDAGLNVVEALQALAEKESAGPGKRVLTDLVQALSRGESFSQAIARFPADFPALYVATVRSSERTGDLKEALGRYIAYREQLDKVRKKVLSAMLYPAILVVVGSLVFAFLMFYVVPRFARVYEDISTELPFFSAALLAAGSWIERNGVLAACLLGAACSGAALALSRPGLRQAAIGKLWRIPALGERMRVYHLARFYRTLGMLLRAGIPALRAVDMVAGLLPGALRPLASRAGRMLEEGHPMSAALTFVGLATPVATRMLVVGERSGQIGDLMDRIARFYDDETARFVDAFTKVFEPLLMAALGLAVGGVVVLMYMPVFELAGSLQ